MIWQSRDIDRRWSICNPDRVQQSVKMLTEIIVAVVRVLLFTTLHLHTDLLAIWRQIKRIALFLRILVRLVESQE